MKGPRPKLVDHRLTEVRRSFGQQRGVVSEITEADVTLVA